MSDTKEEFLARLVELEGGFPPEEVMEKASRDFDIANGYVREQDEERSR